MWFKIENQSVLLFIYAKPNAKHTALLNIANDALHIALHAKPQDGKANAELISFISKLFKIPKTQITLARGDNSRYKQLKIPLTDNVMNVLEQPFFR